LPPGDDAVAAYRRSLLGWYRRAARDLPWRRDPTPYRVWVSEIMLQQTRVETVVPYFERFLRRFPTIEALAAAPLDAVLEAWSGLGYYRRARLLHAGARHVAERHGGGFPEDADDVLSLPGVGRYTAGAIRSIALGQRAAILDGNVTRVLARVFGIEGDVSRPSTSGALWALAARVVERGRPGDVNQAQMELGALVCLPRAPRCAACPCAAGCVALAGNRVHELPQRPRRRSAVDVVRAVLLVQRRDELLLRRRRDDEVSAGLWDFPGAFTGADGDGSTTIEDAAALLPFAVRVGARLGAVRHAVTYRRVRSEVFAAVPVGRVPAALRGTDGAELAWVTSEAAEALALSSPARRTLPLAPGRS
jgi:A/G-specific adenine glycosylase